MSSSLVFGILSGSSATFSRRFPRVFPSPFSPNKFFAERPSYILWNARSQLQLTSASLSPLLQGFRNFSNEKQDSEINVENFVNDSLAIDSGTNQEKKGKKKEKNLKEKNEGPDGKKFKPKSSSEGFEKKKGYDTDKGKWNTKKDFRKGNKDEDSPRPPKKNFGKPEGKFQGRSEGRSEGRSPGRPPGRSEGRSQGRPPGRSEGRYKERFEKSEGKFERRPERRSERKPEEGFEGKKYWKSEENKQELSEEQTNENKEKEEDIPIWRKKMLEKRENPTEKWNPLKKLTRDQMIQLRSMKQKDPKLTSHDLANYFGVDIDSVERILHSKWTPSPDEQSRQESSKVNGDKWATSDKLYSEVGYISKVNEYFMENPSNPIAFEKLEEAARKIIFYSHQLGNMNSNSATLGKKTIAWDPVIQRTWKKKTDTDTNWTSNQKESQQNKESNFTKDRFSNDKPWQKEKSNDESVEKPWRRERKPWQKDSKENK